MSLHMQFHIAEHTLAAATPAPDRRCYGRSFPARHLCRCDRTRSQLPTGTWRLGFRRLSCRSKDQLGSHGSGPCLSPHESRRCQYRGQPDPVRADGFECPGGNRKRSGELQSGAWKKGRLGMLFMLNIAENCLYELRPVASSY